jgi:uncharacterized protein YdgA (DUF945 family)
VNCSKCGKTLHDDERIFCTQCGTPVARTYAATLEIFPERQRGPRWPVLVAIVLLLVVFLVSPFVMGFRARHAYQTAVDQIAASGLTARVLSYRQGWFSSSATIAVGTHEIQTVMVETIHHGPYPIWSGWFSIVPVAAVVDSRPASGLGVHASALPADLLLRTVVYFDGRSQTRVTMQPRTMAGAAGANFLGLDGEITPLPDRLRISLHSPGLVGPGLVGWSITDFAFNGDWQRLQGSIWTGGSETMIREASIGLAGGRRASLQLIDVDTGSALKDGLLKFRGALRISGAVMGSERAGKMALAWQLSKIDPAAIDAWNRHAQALQGTKLDKQAVIAAARSAMTEFALALADKGPQLDANFTMAVPDGPITASLNLSIMPPATGAVADQPASHALLMTQVKERVLSGATVRAPCSFVDRVVGAEKVNNWMRERTLVKDGSQYLLKADFAGGKLMVNGREVLDVEKLPPALKTPPGAAGVAPKST